jgi:cobalt/nickel transport system ATP-binding protein
MLEPTMTKPALALRHVTVRYEPSDPPILVDVSLEVAAGERVALLGLNGSGKTTLLWAAAGLLPHEGTIEVCGIEVVRRNLDEVRKRIGFLFNVPEDQLLFPKVIDDAAFGLSRQAVSPAQATAKTMAVLHAFGVGQLAQSSLHHLSHGQKQRVALAGALVCEPPLLLLDEPSAALDPPGRRHLERMLGAQPAAIVVATHDLDFATGLCTRFVVIEEGRIVFDCAEPNEIRQRWQET